MALILSLDTSTKVCSVAIHEDGHLVGAQSYHLQKSHSSLLPVIIRELFINCEMKIEDLDAVAIGSGPGSYTGLRIGTSTAKGLGYALDLPLISVSSLDSMVAQVSDSDPTSYLCPMLDARRMEVYCKVIDQENHTIWETTPLVVDENSFNDFGDQKLIFFGNGSTKIKDLFPDKGYHFIEGVHPKAEFMGQLAFEKFQQKDFEDLAYFEPNYLKAYRTNTPSKKFSV